MAVTPSTDVGNRLHHPLDSIDTADTCRVSDVAKAGNGLAQTSPRLDQTCPGIDHTPSPPTAFPATGLPANNEPFSAWRTTTRWTLWFLRDQWFLLAMGLVILISSQTQVPSSAQPTKRTITTYLCVSLIFFINGCTLPTRLLLATFPRWRLHLFVQLQSYAVCSATAFAIVSLCATDPSFMDPWLLIGFLFLGAAPTTMASNVVMTRQACGNTALTLVQSVLGQLLCPLLSPALVQMYLAADAWYADVVHQGRTGGYAAIYRRVFTQLGLSLFLPLAVGQAVRYFFGPTCDAVIKRYHGAKLSSLALLTLVWQTFDQAFASGAFADLKASNIAFTVCISIALYLVWTVLCFAACVAWLPRRDVVACCYCCPAKALAMVVPLTSVVYVDVSPLQLSKMQIPAVVFQALQVGVGGLLTIAFRKWVGGEEEEEEGRQDAEKNAGGGSTAATATATATATAPPQT